MLETIQTTNAALPLGHYSQAVKYQNMLFLSGILPVSLGEEPFILLSFEDQVDQVIQHMDAILTASECTKEDIIKVTVYVTDVTKWPVFDKKYAAYIGSHKPARAVVPVPNLHHSFDVEIEIIARSVPGQ